MVELHSVKEEDGGHGEEDQEDTITEATTPTISCDDTMTDVEVTEEPLPVNKTIEDVDKEGDLTNRDDEDPKEKSPTSGDNVVSNKATDKVTMKPVISMVAKLPTDKIITLSTQKPQTLVKSITKPYQAPELQKLTTPFTIATSSFKTGGIDNKLPKSGIITKSLFLPSPTKGTNSTLSTTTKPQNSRSSPVRASSLVRTTSIVLPKPVATVAASSSNNKLTIPTVTTKTLSTLKTTNNGNHGNLAKSTFSVAKPFQSNGTSKVLSTATTPRTLTAPMVSKTLVVSSSTMKASNSLATSKQDVKTLPQKVSNPHMLTASAAAPLTTVMATNTAHNKPVNHPINTSKYEPPPTATSKGV